MKTGQRLLLGLGLGLALAGGVSAADIGTAITYQGFLEDGGGPVTDSCDFEFELYDAATDGSQIDGTLNEVVSVEDGLFTVGLDFGPGAFDGSGARWLDIKVCCPSTCAPGGLETLDPRVELTPAPLALALPGLYTDAAGDTIASGTITSGNSITIDGINDQILSPTTLEIHVGASRVLLLAEGNDPNANPVTAPNIVGGLDENSVGPGVSAATIAGGGSAGFPNVVTGSWGAIGGGDGNTAGPGVDATVGGGFLNTASAFFATVGGGVRNAASGLGAAVGGGRQNTASANDGTVGGGFDNEAAGFTTTVAGGGFNTAGPGQGATVGGGQVNTASGFHSTVPGGNFNTAAGEYSLAAGRRAKANHNGSFVWGDSANADCISAATDEFRICAAGGVEVEGDIHASGTITSGNSITIDGITDTITSTSGTISFDDENLTTTGLIESGAAGFKFPDGTVQSSAAMGVTVGTVARNPLQIALLRWYEANESGVTFSVGTGPIGVAFDGANIWVANSASANVTKLRASDGALLGTFSVGTDPDGVAFDGANIWVANQRSNNVTKLRASDGAVLGTFNVGTDPLGVAFDGANIWVANAGDNTVSKLRASDGTVLGTFSVGTTPVGVAFDGANIWVTNFFDSNVSKLRASDGALLGTFNVGTQPQGVAFDGANIWVTNANSNSVTKLRASDGTLLGTFNVGTQPQGVAFDGANIWVANRNSNNVTKLRASDGALLGTFSVGLRPQGVAFDGANIWVANSGFGSANVTKL